MKKALLILPIIAGLAGGGVAYANHQASLEAKTRLDAALAELKADGLAEIHYDQASFNVLTSRWTITDVRFIDLESGKPVFSAARITSDYQDLTSVAGFIEVEHFRPQELMITEADHHTGNFFHHMDASFHQDISFNEASGDLDVDLSYQDPSFGQASLSLSLGSARELVKTLEAINQAQQDGNFAAINEDTAEALKEQLMPALYMATFKDARVNVKDNGLVDAFFQMTPREIGQQPEQLRQQAITMAKAGNPDHQAFGDFLKGYHQLDLSITTSRPVAFAEMEMLAKSNDQALLALFDTHYRITPL